MTKMGISMNNHTNVSSLKNINGVYKTLGEVIRGAEGENSKYDEWNGGYHTTTIHFKIVWKAYTNALQFCGNKQMWKAGKVSSITDSRSLGYWNWGDWGTLKSLFIHQDTKKWTFLPLKF